jgi:hypothetical protein
MLRAMTIVSGSTVLRSVDQRNPLVNASSAQRMILRIMRRERPRGSQLNRRSNEPITVVVHQVCVFDIALDAVPCGRRPDARSVGP